MNYNNPKLVSALAARYVLGTLRGKARDRFDALKFSNALVRSEIDYWEAQLNPMSLVLAPVQVDAAVWTAIENRIVQTKNSQPTSNVVSLVKPEQASATKWKWVSGLAMAACLVLAILLVPYTTTTTEPLQSIAVVNNEAKQTLWTFSVAKDQILVQTTQLVPRLPNNDYQLWIVPASGEAPISIGVMAQEASFYLDKPDIFDNIEIAALAVSQEPKGGSPNGAPTTVLYAAELALL
jgi:anti-sigma-K factor RskA